MWCVASQWEQGQNILEETCERGRALRLSVAVAVSPDSRNVYVAAKESDAVTVLDREPGGVALTQRPGEVGCVSASGTNGTCVRGRALREPTGVAVSPDGRNVYVASQGEDAVAIFDRDPATGELTQGPGPAGCVSERGSGGGCEAGDGLRGARAVVVSPKGDSVYVASDGSHAVASFDRDPATGALTQQRGADGCISGRRSDRACRRGRGLGFPTDLAVSPDGRSVYVAAGESGIAVLARDPDTGALSQAPGPGGCISPPRSQGACRVARAIKGVEGVAVSPDGRSVYVASHGATFNDLESNAVAIFDRDPATGELHQKPGVEGCVSELGRMGSCRRGKGLDGANSVTVSPDGRNVYASAYYADGVTIFDRDPRSGGLTQKRGGAGCISSYEEVGCRDDVVLLGLPADLAIGADGGGVFVASSIFEGGILAFRRSAASGRLSTEVRGMVEDE